MLEQTRRQASIFIYLIFGLLIVIFILGINPGNRSGREGCGVTSNVEVAVDGDNANHTSYLVAYSAARDYFGGASGRQKVYLALDQLIRRELLAQAAEEQGIRATGDQIDQEIIQHKRGSFYAGGQRYDVTPQFFDQIDGENLFKHDRWLRWINAHDVQSAGSYRDEQARGLQAALMSDLVTSSVRVSRDEALADYLYDNNTVTYDVVAFDPQRYRRAMRLTDADIKRFLETHGAEVQARYKADERTYKGIKPQLALREIFIPKAIPEPAKAAEPDDKAAKTDDKAKAAKPDDKAAKTDNKAAKTDNKTAKPDDKAAKTDNKVAKVDDKAKTAKPDDKAKTAKADDKKPAAGDAPKPFGLPIDVAKAKLEAVRAQIAAGKLTFPDAEKQLAADSSEDAPAENGDRGWMSVDSLSLGEKAISDAAKTLKPGEMTAVVVSDRGAYLVIATDKREGDLTFDQVKNELAKELAKDVWSKEAAKRGALEIIAKVQAGALNSLEPTFEREPVKPPAGNELQDILNDPSLTDEQKQMILQQYMKRMQQQQKHGSLEVHEKDVPVAWFAEADGSGQTGSAAQAPASGSAAAPAGAATTGSAATGSAAVGAGSGTAPPAPPAPPARPAEIVASNDVLPQFGEVPRPKVNRLGPSPRQAKMPGIGASKEAADALFDELAKNDVAKKIYEGEAGYLLIQLIDRSQPKVEDFDKTADVEIARMQEARGKAALRDWVKSRCETLAKAGRIRPSPDRIRETDDKGNPAPTVYHPCMYFDYLDR